MKAWLTPREVAAELDVSYGAAARLCRDGHLRCMRLTDSPYGRMRIRRDWLEDFIEANSAGGRAPVAASVAASVGD